MASYRCAVNGVEIAGSRADDTLAVDFGATKKLRSEALN